MAHTRTNVGLPSHRVMHVLTNGGQPCSLHHSIVLLMPRVLHAASRSVTGHKHHPDFLRLDVTAALPQRQGRTRLFVRFKSAAVAIMQTHSDFYNCPGYHADEDKVDGALRRKEITSERI
jgi:hypothetical protein